MAVDAERAEFDGGVLEADGGLVGDAHGVDVALPVVEDVAKRRRLWGRKSVRLGDATRNALPHVVRVEVEPRLDIRRELVADIAADPCGVPVL